ncbi:Sec-independent protein translocase protein TatAd [uncultured Clostridium sp.]|uniref:twin-arginine translocase TatA/TatE family subunit n=1 Tax=uncultured Clostridium sp. TaxID=59620 RepID=UPI000820908F|nr:twin-arginine translocase TatA/TatE family subunit [uncultured Clostridium sp.]SCI80454.1 Sec-independent protein translocase protein TatAd [uncultured Clostridium sp.]
MFGKIGAGELILILAIALIIFGPSKLPQIGKSMGQAIKEFRKGTSQVQKEINSLVDDEPEA